MSSGKSATAVNRLPVTNCRVDNLSASAILTASSTLGRVPRTYQLLIRPNEIPVVSASQGRRFSWSASALSTSFQNVFIFSLLHFLLPFPDLNIDQNNVVIKKKQAFFAQCLN